MPLICTKRAIWALNIVPFYALAMMLLIISSQTASLEDAVATYFFNYDVKFFKNDAKKVNFLQHCRKLVEIRCHKGAGTNMFRWAFARKKISLLIMVSEFIVLKSFFFQYFYM